MKYVHLYYTKLNTVALSNNMSMLDFLLKSHMYFYILLSTDIIVYRTTNEEYLSMFILEYSELIYKITDEKGTHIQA